MVNVLGDSVSCNVAHRYAHHGVLNEVDGRESVSICVAKNPVDEL